MNRKEKVSKVIESFEEVYSGKYPIDHYKDYPKWVGKLLKNKKGKFLDIGCGGGEVVKFLRNKKINAFGIDITPQAIKIAKSKYITVGDILNNNFKDSEFLVSGSNWVLEHIGEYELATKEMCRISDNVILYTENNATLRRPLGILKYLIKKKKYTHNRTLEKNSHNTYDLCTPVIFDLLNEFRKNKFKIIEAHTWHKNSGSNMKDFIGRVFSRIPIIKKLGPVTFIVAGRK